MYGFDTSQKQLPVFQATSVGQTSFTLPYALKNSDSCEVLINRVVQIGNFSVLNNVITFDTAIPSGYEVLVIPRFVEITRTFSATVTGPTTGKIIALGG